MSPAEVDRHPSEARPADRAQESVLTSTSASALPQRPRGQVQLSVSRARAISESTAGLLLLRVCAFLILLGLWQLCSGTLIDPFWVSSPSAIAIRIGRWIASGYLWDQLGVTLEEAALGFVVGAAIGTLLGGITGYYRSLGKVIEPLILALYSMPAIALAPLFILWFGIGLESKVAVSALTVLFIVFFNVYAGLRDVDDELLTIVRVLGAKRRHVMSKVIGPSILTYVFLGLKVALPFALIGAVVAEMVSATHGIGYLMQYSVSQFDTTGVFVGLVVISAVSVVLGAGLPDPRAPSPELEAEG